LDDLSLENENDSRQNYVERNHADFEVIAERLMQTGRDIN